MKNKRKMFRTFDLFHSYALLFGIWIFFRTTGNLDIFSQFHINIVSNLAKILLIFMSIFFISIRKIKIIQWISLFVIFSITIINAYDSKNLDILFLFLVIFSVYDKDIEYMAKHMFLGMLLGIICVLFLYKIGILEDVVQIRLGKLRHSFGFSLPIILPSIYFSLCSTYVFIRRSHLKLIEVSIFILFLIPIMYFCDGRAPGLLTILVLSGTFFSERYLINKKYFLELLYIIALSTFIFAILFSIFFAVNYNSSFGELNELFTGRLEWWNLYWDKYDIKIFGQHLIRVGGAAVLSNSSLEMMILDNSYLSILLERGWILFLIFIYIIFKVLKFFKNRGETTLIILLICWVAYGITSNELYFIDRNIMLFPLTTVMLAAESWQLERRVSQ